MISVLEASQIINATKIEFAIGKVPLADALGHVLAHDVVADRDLPPYDKVTMDGIAIRYEDWEHGTREFPILGEQLAGSEPLSVEMPSSCVEIMTGAVIPPFYDTVVRYEDVEINTGLRLARILDINLRPHQNVQSKGLDKHRGEAMLQSGVRLCSADVAILASIGMHEVAVRKFPKTAIISTGDELVDVESTPLSYQIRKSNVWALSAALSALQIEHQRYHLNDDLNQLESQLKLILDEFKVVILSGGVSKGKADFVPQVLDQLGVKKLFHRVDQKPGKPFWFGSHNFDNVVFALPGNPVSTLLCFYRYFRPWYFKIMDCEQEIKFAELGQDYEFSSKLTYFLQVKTFFDQASLKAIPMNGKGSGDFSSLADADGFLELPAEQTYYRAGQIFPYFEYRNS